MNNMTTQFHLVFHSKNIGEDYYITQVADTYEEAVNDALKSLKVDVDSYDIECIAEHEVAKTNFLSGEFFKSEEELNEKLEDWE